MLGEIRRRRPDLPVVLMTAYGVVEQAVEAMRAGAADYLTKPVEAEQLLALVAQAAQRRAGRQRPPGFVAEDPASMELLRLAARVARSSATVLLTGESGSGKEMIARYVHASSPRASGAFVAINCAAIPENLLEATLFGYERGAYTGAQQSQAGKFEQADGGTLLLDEISEMPLGLQAKLLRVLQEREVERVGGRKPIALDLRVLATTNRDLEEMVRDGRVSRGPVLPAERLSAAGAAAARARRATSCRSRGTSSRASPTSGACASARRPRRCCARMPGPATCASSRTPCSAR